MSKWLILIWLLTIWGLSYCLPSIPIAANPQSLFQFGQNVFTAVVSSPLDVQTGGPATYASNATYTSPSFSTAGADLIILCGTVNTKYGSFTLGNIGATAATIRGVSASSNASNPDAACEAIVDSQARSGITAAMTYSTAQYWASTVMAFNPSLVLTTFHQTTYVAETSSPLTHITSPALTLAGTSTELVVVFCRNNDVTGTVTDTVTSTPSNSWTQLQLWTNSNGFGPTAQASYTVGPGSGSTTFTCTPSSTNSYQSMVVLDY